MCPSLQTSSSRLGFGMNIIIAKILKFLFLKTNFLGTFVSIIANTEIFFRENTKENSFVPTVAGRF